MTNGLEKSEKVKQPGIKNKKTGQMRKPFIKVIPEFIKQNSLLQTQ
jgi:hypothetical protein